MLMLFISTNIETSVMLCLTAKLRGLQEARLCLAAEGGSVSAPKGLQDGASLRSVRTSALVLIVSALTSNTCQPACYLQLVSEGDMGEVSIRGGPCELSDPADYIPPCSATFVCSGLEIPGNLKWLLYVHSVVISVHCGSVIAFFVAQPALSSSFRSRVCVCVWVREMERETSRVTLKHCFTTFGSCLLLLEIVHW